MKLLNIDYQIGMYSVEVNNCIDYNIAGVSGFYKKDFFQLYCSFWGLFSNFLSYNQEYVRLKILDLFGLKLKNIKVLESATLISLIIEKIDCENPVIINTPNSVLFYSIMYKNSDVKRMNHSFIINGYDDSRDIFYIRENTINSDVLSILTSSQPFSEYYLTYNMLEDIYNETYAVLDNKREIDSFFQFMTCKEEVSIDKLIIEFINYCIEYFNNNKDLLYIEIEQMLNGKKYDSLYLNEQFRRTTVHSFKPVFDEIKKLLPLEFVSDFINFTNDYLKLREKIVNIIAKNSIKNSKINENYLTKILYDLNSYNKKIGLFCKKIIYKENMYYKNLKIICDDAIVTADSEYIIGSKIFFSKSVLSELKVDNYFNFWMSDTKTRKHWIKIDFNRNIDVNKIVIEHRTNIKYITKDYKILISIDGKKWISIVNVKNNKEVFNEYNFENKISFRFFKMNIYEPNNGIDNFARISKIDFYQQIDNIN